MRQRSPGQRTFHRAVMSLSIGSLLLMTTEAALGLLIQLYLKSIGASPVIIGLSSSFAWVGTLLAGPVWGNMADRHSKRLLLSLVFAGSGVATAALGVLFPATGTLVVSTMRSLILQGLAPVGMACISAGSAAHIRGRNMAAFSSSRAAGFIFGGIFGGFLLSWLGFRWTFVLLAVFPLLGLLFVQRVDVREGPSPSKPAPKAPLAALWNREIILLYTAIALRQVATGAVGAFSFVYMATHGLSSATMGFVGAISPLTGTLTTFLFGWMADRFGRRIVIWFGFAIVVIYPFLYSMARTPLTFALATLPLGLSFASYYTGSTSRIGDIVPFNRQGAMLGILESSRGLGGVIGPVLGGALVTFLGYERMFLSMSAIAFIAFVIVLIGLWPSAAPPIKNREG